ncbi:MAG: metallophosphoesterase [Burkholderiales bacterium]|nr:metallophosphoesterase [Phycisphaerae bacterium]
MRWIIGDIHGMLKPLELLLREISRRDSKPDLIFCGDYVNRGPDSREVVDLLLSLQNASFVRGNHDDTFDLLLSGKCFVPHAPLTSIVPTFEHFMKYGLEQTLLSYGIAWDLIDQVRRHPSPDTIMVMLDPVPMTHRTFFRTLPVVYGAEEFFVAHAKWSVNVAAGAPSFAAQLARSQTLRHEILWGRFTLPEIISPKPWDRRGFFGHTPVTMYAPDEMLPVIGENMVLLDTAAAVHIDGCLTAWCFEEDNYLQAGRDGDWVR